MSTAGWDIGLRVDRAETGRRLRDLFADRIATTAVEPALGVRHRNGVGWSLFHGATAVARAADVAGLAEQLAWFLAGLADQPQVDEERTTLRVLVGEHGAVLIDAELPTLLGAHAWRRAGWWELPLPLSVRLRGSRVALPQFGVDLLGRTTSFAGRELDVVNVVVITRPGEDRDDAVGRVRQQFGRASRRQFDQWLADDRVLVAGSRNRAVARLLNAPGGVRR